MRRRKIFALSGLLVVFKPVSEAIVFIEGINIFQNETVVDSVNGSAHAERTLVNLIVGFWL